jgi:hypothetical protein
MTEKIALGIFAVIAVFALVLLFSSTITGNASTNICPEGSAPVISGERYIGEFQEFHKLGYYCFFGDDGFTPCCLPQSRISQYEYLSDRESYELPPSFP